MNTSWWVGYWKLGLVSFVAMGYAIAFNRDCALAQITPDGTLGAESSVVTPTAPGSPVDVIDGGATRGANLFHSFEQFSVPPGGEASFNNAANIQNIISRVTGGSISNIDGLLRANGTANLFLLNPNGIIFGPNASLNIGGSFVGSTASSLNFADGTQFSATAPQTTPLLTVSVPIGLQYGGTAGSILNRSRATNSSGGLVGLQVQPGNTLMLMGGDVRWDGGNLYAPGGRVELGGVAGAGTVGLNVDSNNLSLSYPTSMQRTDVSLTNGAIVYVAAGDGGSIAVNARNLDVLGGSSLVAGIRQDLGSVDSQAGDITLNATGTITVADSNIFNNVEAGAVGNGGIVDIKAGSLFLTNGAQIQAILRDASNELGGGRGNGGKVVIDVRDSFTISGSSNDGYSSKVFTSVGFGAEGKGGEINVTTGSLYLTDGAQLNAYTDGQGDAGNVTINARDTVSFDGVGSSKSPTPSGTVSTVRSRAVGNGGSVNITTGSLSLTNGAGLQSLTRGKGDAGKVTINARDTVSFEGVNSSNGSSSGVFSYVEVEGRGNAGDINISTGSLTVKNGALLAASTRGQGDAGSVNINARDTVSFDGVGSNGFPSGAGSTVESRAVGNGVGINITTGSLSLANGAQLAASTSGQGNGGNVTINANTLSAVNGGQVLTTSRSSGKAGNITLNVSDSITLAGSDRNYFARPVPNPLLYGEVVVGGAGPDTGLFANTSENSTGQGGDLRITTGQLLIRDGAQVSAETAGTGSGGTLAVSAPESVTLSGMASLSAQATADGNAGNLTINTSQLRVQDGAKVSTSTTSGVGGDITLGGLNSLQVSNGGEISASTATGQAGSLSVNANENAADTVQLSGQGSGLSAQATGGGNAGSLTINARKLTVQDGAKATVSSPEGQAGNLTVTADSIRLDEGELTAVTGVSKGDEGGANITLEGIDLLLMRNESRISAEAFGTANGGNVTLNSAFLSALSSEGLNGSDIIAKAEQGNGGRINITTQGTFGIEERKANPGNRTNDIDASSQFGRSGSVELNTPDVDPSQGLVELPAELVDASNSIAQGCPDAVWRGESKFIITGRGGLPPSPTEPLRGDNTLTNWSTLDSDVENRSSAAPATNPTSESAPTTIVEANGWVKSDNGEVTLVATSPSDTLDIPWLPSTDCNAPEPSS